MKLKKRNLLIPFFIIYDYITQNCCKPKPTTIAAIGEYPNLRFSPIIQIIERQEVSSRIKTYTGRSR